MSLIRKHVAVLQAWACLDLVLLAAVIIGNRWCDHEFWESMKHGLLLGYDEPC